MDRRVKITLKETAFSQSQRPGAAKHPHSDEGHYHRWDQTQGPVEPERELAKLASLKVKQSLDAQDHSAYVMLINHL
jgi:hypothetical protein